MKSMDTEEKLLGERVQRLRSEKEQIQILADDKDIQLRSAMEKVAICEDSSESRDVHVWWAYVWHELRRQEKEAQEVTKLGQGIQEFLRPNIPSDSVPKDALHSIDQNVAAVVLQSSNLRESLHSQAVEIACLRQVISSCNG